ncbi:putative tubulin-specific chaperone B [Tribonema minus]|uniref:Putative tubulin-specific chaperone B n=1 Tax=Tribonema minus TaxID=303371 RepID=A0A835ZAK6_9STRA|nr:putative tubulin-specific chaperone B [Tribonema minus]
MSADMAALKGWVTAADANMYKSLPHGTVSLTVTHSNLKATMIELKFDLHQTIESVKRKIYTHCGTKPDSQKLQLRSAGRVLTMLADDSRMLGYYGAESGMEVHVMDTDPFSLSRGGGLEDVSLVQKYRMTDEEYDQRKGTLRSWIKEHKAKDPKWVAPWNGGPTDAQLDAQAKEAEAPPPGPESVEGMKVGDRCEVSPGGRRGAVMFLGEVEGMAPGYWVGVRFDEPVGRGNGTVKGKQIFVTEEKHASFIRPKNVAVGDYPEKDLLDELDDSEDEI